VKEAEVQMGFRDAATVIPGNSTRLCGVGGGLKLSQAKLGLGLGMLRDR